MLDLMVAVPGRRDTPTRRGARAALPWPWRVTVWCVRALVAMTGRLEITGEVPAEAHGRPLILAANHIGNADPFVLLAACHRLGLAPRFLATRGLFEIPGLGRLLRAGGHVPVDRGKRATRDSLDRVVTQLKTDDRPILIYPEGRISLEPDLWPERGKTGVSRMALSSRALVIPISQWGAHEAIRYGKPELRKIRDAWPLFISWLCAIPHRPVLRVHFGHPVNLADLADHRIGDATRARDRIMRAITDGLIPLRAAEPDSPSTRDTTRPISNNRSPWR